MRSALPPPSSQSLALATTALESGLSLDAGEFSVRSEASGIKVQSLCRPTAIEEKQRKVSNKEEEEEE